MKIRYTPKFKTRLREFQLDIRAKFYKQARYLLKDLRHPSLRAKKYDSAEDIWQARVNGGIRFYFLIVNDTYILLDIRKHSE